MSVALQTLFKCYFIKSSDTPKGLCGTAQVTIKLEVLRWSREF